MEEPVKNDPHKVSKNAVNSNAQQGSILRQYDEIGQLMEHARLLQDHKNWDERSDSIIFGCSVMC